MEFKNGYNFMYQKLKAIYASKTGKPEATNEPVDLGLSEEDIKKLKLVYETKDSLMFSFKNIPTKDDRAFELTIDGEPVIGPSVGPGPKPISLYKVKPGDKFINMHFNTSVAPVIDDFVIAPESDSNSTIYAIGPVWDWYYDDKPSYFNDGFTVMYIPAGTYIEDFDLTIEKDAFMIALPEGGIPIYASEGLLEFYQIIKEHIPEYPVPAFYDINKVKPGWYGTTLKEAMQVLIDVIGDDADYRSAKEHCQKYLNEGAYGKISADTEVGGVYEAPWNGKLAGFTEADYKPITLKRVSVGDFITNYKLSRNEAVVNYLKNLNYQADYPVASQNMYVNYTGYTAGAASVATVYANGTVIYPGGKTAQYLEDNSPILLATKSTYFNNLTLMILPILYGRRVYFNPECTPNLTSSSYNWQAFGEDEFTTVPSGSSYLVLHISETAFEPVQAEHIMVASRHSDGNGGYTYKLYLSRYPLAHDDGGNLSGTLLYDNNTWVKTYYDFGKDNYAGYTDYDDRAGFMENQSPVAFNGVDKYTIYQSGPTSGSEMVTPLDALYQSSGEQLVFLSGASDNNILCYNLYDETGWVKGYVTMELDSQSQERPFIFRSYTPYSVTESAIDCNVQIESLIDLPIYTEE